jgi:hypothetical protein
MIDAVVSYLHEAGVPFRLTSYPAPEAQPRVAHRIAPTAQMVEAHVVLMDGRPALACTLRGEAPSLAALATETGAMVLETTTADLPFDRRPGRGLVPPLGRLFGVPLFVDVRVSESPIVAFRAFGENDYLELSYEDLALVERPRVAAFAELAELPPHES